MEFTRAWVSLAGRRRARAVHMQERKADAGELPDASGTTMGREARRLHLQLEVQTRFSRARRWLALDRLTATHGQAPTVTKRGNKEPPSPCFS